MFKLTNALFLFLVIFIGTSCEQPAGTPEDTPGVTYGEVTDALVGTYSSTLEVIEPILDIQDAYSAKILQIIQKQEISSKEYTIEDTENTPAQYSGTGEVTYEKDDEKSIETTSASINLTDYSSEDVTVNGSFDTYYSEELSGNVVINIQSCSYNLTFTDAEINTLSGSFSVTDTSDDKGTPDMEDDENSLVIEGSILLDGTHYRFSDIFAMIQAAKKKM